MEEETEDEEAEDGYQEESGRQIVDQPTAGARKRIWHLHDLANEERVVGHVGDVRRVRPAVARVEVVGCARDSSVRVAVQASGTHSDGVSYWKGACPVWTRQLFDEEGGETGG
eukprot:3022860-Rhodomonas_salina.2